MHKFDFFYVISQSETRNNKKKVIFIMDLTGSMGIWLNEAKKNIKKIII